MTIKLAIIGAGNRGMEVYGELARNYGDKVKVVAVVDPNDFKRDECAKRHSIPPEWRFTNEDDFFRSEKIADAVIIATPDRKHDATAKEAILKGYHVLLEKPMSANVERLRELRKVAQEHPQQLIMVCHVMRYTPYFQKLKELLDSGRIGKVVSVQHNENIGYYHFAHSYVRGNWRNSTESSPVVLAKSSHDMDILRWLIGSNCTTISAFGGLSHFKREGAPDYAVPRCKDCIAVNSCPYSAYKIYHDPKSWPGSVVAPAKTQEELDRNLEQGPYGRCVYYCDNDNVDHLSMAMEFENGVSAVFNLSAFTTDISRTLKIMGTLGEIRGDALLNEIEVSIFGQGKDTIKPEVVEGGHGGGDPKLFDDFIDCLSGSSGKYLTSVEQSIESHIMSFAAERSRVTGQVVKLSDIR